MPNKSNAVSKKEKQEAKDKMLHSLNASDFRSNRTFGQKAADGISKWAGSWTFIIGFFVFIIFYCRGVVALFVILVRAFKTLFELSRNFPACAAGKKPCHAKERKK